MLGKNDIALLKEMFAEQEQRINNRMDDKFAEQEQNIMQNVAVLMEAKFQPQFNLLAEGQRAILEKMDAMTPKAKTEELEEEIKFLKSIVKIHSEQIQELKKAL